MRARTPVCTFTGVELEQNGVWLWENEKEEEEEEGCGGGSSLRAQPSQTTPIPTQTPTLPHPWRDHPPLAPLLIEHRAPRPLWVPGDCSRATV